MLRSTLWWIAGGIFLAGVFLAHDWWTKQQRFESMRSWPQVNGTVIQTKLESVRPRPSMPDRYRGFVAYQYRVEGVLFDGSERTPTESKPSGCREWLEQRPVGSRVAVYYDPEAPGDSVLNPKPNLDAREYGVASQNSNGNAAIVLLGLSGSVLGGLLMTASKGSR